PEIVEGKMGGADVQSVTTKEPEVPAGIKPGRAGLPCARHIARARGSQCTVDSRLVGGLASGDPSPLTTVESPKIVEAAEGPHGVAAKAPEQPELPGRIGAIAGLKAGARRVAAGRRALRAVGTALVYRAGPGYPRPARSVEFPEIVQLTRGGAAGETEPAKK